MQMILVIASVLSILPWCAVHGRPDEQYTLGDHGDVRNPADNTYSFHYEVIGHSSRSEELDESGEVEGSYSFVSPEGEKFEFKYEADEDGFVVESDALPVAPEDTDEVKQAKEEFFKAYCKALGEEDCDIRDYDKHESYEEASVESYEDSDEESDEDSSEEDSEEEAAGEEAAGEEAYRFKRKSISDGSFSKRIQNLRNFNSQNLSEKENDLGMLSKNRNGHKLHKATSHRNSHQGRPGFISSYQTTHGLQNMNEKSKNLSSPQTLTKPVNSSMKQNVLGSLFHKRQGVRPSLLSLGNKEIKTQRRQGLGSTFKKMRDQRRQNRFLTKAHTEVKNSIHSNKERSNTPNNRSSDLTNHNSTLKNHSIKNLNTKSDQKVSLKAKQLRKNLNQRIRKVKHARRILHRGPELDSNNRQKVKSFGNPTKEPGLSYTYSVSFGEK